MSSDDPADRVCSIFISPLEAMLAHCLAWNDLGVVRVAVHQPGPRVAEWLNVMEPESEHGLLILGEQDDVDERIDGWTVGVEGQKFGGRPTFLQREKVQDEWNALEADGFSQLVQFGWPERLPGIDFQGNWPFGRGAFSLAFRPTSAEMEWRWCWQLG